LTSNPRGPDSKSNFEPWQVNLLFNALCDAYHRRKLSLEALRAILKELVVADSHGRLWTIGVQSGKWYRHAKGGWVEDEPRGPLTPARLNSTESRASQSTIQLDRRARRSQEFNEDRSAEEARQRRGLTPEQELEQIKEARPVFMEEYDKREHQRLLRLWKETEERAKAQGAQPLPGPYTWYTGSPPKRPWIYDLERYLNELSPDQLRLYENWKRSIDSFWRRFPEKWGDPSLFGEKEVGV